MLKLGKKKDYLDIAKNHGHIEYFLFVDCAHLLQDSFKSIIFVVSMFIC
jgi:hypothetical protein